VRIKKQKARSARRADKNLRDGRKAIFSERRAAEIANFMARVIAAEFNFMFAALQRGLICKLPCLQARKGISRSTFGAVGRVTTAA